MIGLGALWLPILVSSVAVFVVSSVIHMMSPWHKSDYPKLANEDQVMDALRRFAIPPGDYFVPRPMGKRLASWFLYSVVVGLFAAYIAGQALPAGAGFRQVLRFAGVTAFVGYALALWQMSIWYGRAWLATIKATIDSVIYALVTAAILGW